MTVESSSPISKRVFYQLSVGDQYDPSERLKVTDSEFNLNNGTKVSNSVHAMSGFYLIDETFSTDKDETIGFRISGDCLAIVIFYDGKCLVRDVHTDKTQSYEAGMIRSVAFEDGSWELVLSAGQKVSYLSIIISRKFLNKMTQTETWASDESDYPDFYSFQRDRLVFINPEIKSILHQFLNPVYRQHYRRGYFELKLRELLFLIHIQYEQGADTNNVSPQIYSKLIGARAYLAENYVDNPSIGQLARIVSLNEFSLKTHFKAMFGTTIHRFVTQLRMESAAQMLLEDRFVADVAAATGYQSVSHFISVYKKHFGKTPKRAQLSPSASSIRNAVASATLV